MPKSNRVIMLDWAPNLTTPYTGSKQVSRMLLYTTVHSHTTSQ